MENEIVIFETEDESISLQVKLTDEMVWLSRNQLSVLFDRDVKTIGKHINNALKEEVDDSTVAKFATVQMEGEREVERTIEYYNLEMITSVGYRVKSKRGVEFRRWANKVLKEYILRGYAVNEMRLKQLGSAVRLMKRVEKDLDAKQVLNVVECFATALDLLDDYDHQTMKRPKGNTEAYVLSYEECRNVIDNMKFSGRSDLFGSEKDDSFKGSIGNIYQSFGGQEIYPTLEEKAANLLYFVTKNHSFWDGNKRIAAAMFLYFLDRNGVLFDDEGEKTIDDHTLVALTIMIAESKPEEKEMMISVVMNCISMPDKNSQQMEREQVERLKKKTNEIRN
ncbi:MAG: type II toxin-antitoxin system death-on-curing family toxin [Lachnospiraceae bacterium]|nr:type II toxin-antitoxin system death-on-curing family toxin [Lachnospiraceae bacterium]